MSARRESITMCTRHRVSLDVDSNVLDYSNWGEFELAIYKYLDLGL